MHLLTVAFVVSLPILVCVGWLRRWRWVRIPALRFLHLMIMVYIVAENKRNEGPVPTTAISLGLAFDLLEDPDDLGFCESTLAHVVLREGCTLSVQVSVDSNCGVASDGPD